MRTLFFAILKDGDDEPRVRYVRGKKGGLWRASNETDAKEIASEEKEGEVLEIIQNESTHYFDRWDDDLLTKVFEAGRRFERNQSPATSHIRRKREASANPSN
jgi:hypothetical protein